jgi:pimeloyl-ACP methyl ester carboxylesterase
VPPPPRPSPVEEWFSSRLFRALAPRLQRGAQPAPPERLAPFEEVAVPRPGRRGSLAATWFPAPGATCRGAVLLVPPWLQWGKAYFHRRGRIQALRRCGYSALAMDFPGFGGSGAPDGFFDRPVADGLASLAERSGGAPLFVWGISSGGYWSHPVLSRTEGVAAAFFEEVSPHLLEWAGRHAPWATPFHRVFRTLFPRSFRFLDLRRHAPHLRVQRVAYVSGETDPGVLPEDTRTLAHLAAGGGRAVAHRIVPGAGHLEAIKRAGSEVIALALATFDNR